MNIIGPKSLSQRSVACLLITTLSLLLSACASAYKVKVDALTSPKPEPTASYKIVNRNPHIETDSLRHKEVEKAVKTALSGKGMYEAPSDTDADVIINLEYGIKAPEITQEVHYKSIYRSKPGVNSEDPPTQIYDGEKAQMVPVAVYEKYLRLSARENTTSSEESRPAQEVWAVDVTSTGKSTNLRKYIPIMAAATIGYIGKETTGQKSIWLTDEDDSDIAFVKKGPLTGAGEGETDRRVPAHPLEPDKAVQPPALPFATSLKS